MTQEEDAGKPRRPNASAAERREIRAALAPIVTELSNWQLQIAHAKAKLNRNGLDDGERAKLRALADDIEAGKRTVARVRGDLAGPLRENSRLSDVERALSQMQERLQGLPLR